MKNFITTIALTALLSTAASAANVDVRISTREAYVGSPVTLQLAISDAAGYDPPSLPTIDGCDVRSAGSPSQSSRITIINGRRTESRSVTMQYLITPRRAGTFTIPAMTFKVDGKTVTTEPLRFVATKSETGDLLFVEIEGGKEKVFVGQPLDLQLKLWIKPFRDPKTGHTLSEGDMWNMISDSTSWGGFADRMKEMTENRQRPGGQEVLHDDGNGGERAYYLYEINATVYPKRAGKIDADDVQIVVDYPTAIGKSGTPFDSMFDDRMFGGSSMLSRMMNDDFFGSSFAGRLAVTGSRPIVGEVSVDATEVLPVPTAGRPADYRGAVGNYRIVTQANPATVDAGDPITLNIGIAGTGPMELVQAPPLFEQSELTKDFKVADESLAGFVQDDTKLFSTTIRPRREGITEIPAIRFSFFDPESETFQTVTSDPIAITVNKSETLTLDAIVGNARSATPGAVGPRIDARLPDFTNHGGPSVLISQAPRGRSHWWWAFVIFPPFVWLGAFIAKYRGAIADRLPNFSSPKAKCLSALQRAKDHDAIADAVVNYVCARTRTQHPEASTKLAADYDSQLTRQVCRATEAVGRLRVAGLYQVAAEVELFLSQCHAGDVQALASSATELVERVDAAISRNRKTKVKTMLPKRSKMKLARPAGLLIAAIVIASATATPAVAEVAKTLDQPALKLSASSAATLLAEATEAYNQGIAKSQSDAATAKDLLAIATEKYQLLVRSGIRNADLFTNLGNAYLQTGQLGHAIASYEKALQLDPSNAQATQNLAFANGKVAGVQTLASSATTIRSLNNSITELIGTRPIIWLLAFSSLAFWGLLILRIVHRRFPVWKCAAVPFVLLLTSLGSVGLTETNAMPTWNAVIVADNVNLQAGDGEQFAPVVTLDAAQGHRVETLATRGNWTQVRTAEGYVGWVHDRDVERLNFDGRGQI